MAVVIVAMLFGVLGIILGWRIGTVWGAGAKDDHQYWMRNLAAVLIGIAVAAVITATGLVTLLGLGIGMLGGCIAGLKMGYGKSVGAWAKADKFFRVNKDQVEAAKSAERAKNAGMSEQEQANRDMVSVDPSGTSKGLRTRRNR